MPNIEDLTVGNCDIPTQIQRTCFFNATGAIIPSSIDDETCIEADDLQIGNIAGSLQARRYKGFVPADTGIETEDGKGMQ